MLLFRFSALDDSPPRFQGRGCFICVVLLIGLACDNTAESGDRRHARQARRNGYPALMLSERNSRVIPQHSTTQHCGVENRPEILTTPFDGSLPNRLPEAVSEIAAKPEVFLIGYSVKGVPIVMQVFGVKGPITLVFGAIHGSEPNSGDLARRLLDYLLEHPEHYSARRVAIIPVANPDGLVRNQRTNEHKIDLNRNFPALNWAESKSGPNFGGEAAASEPETQAIIKSVELLNPHRIISIHAITRGRECNNYDGPGADLANLLKSKNGYRVAKTIGYPTPGSFGSWAGVDRQIATITLELPHDLPGEECWKTHKDALLAVIQEP